MPATGPVADQGIGPAGDHEGADDSCQRVHPEPTERERQRQSYNDENGNRRVGDDVNDRGPHVVIARRRAVCLFVLYKIDGVTLAAHLEIRREGVRFWDFLDGLHVAVAIHHRESPPSAALPHRFNFDGVRSQSLACVRAQPEARRHAVLEYFKRDDPGTGRDVVRFVMVMPFVLVPVNMAVMMPAAAQEPRTRDVYGQAKTGNRDRLAEMDRDRREDTADGS